MRLRFPRHDQPDLALGTGPNGLVRQGGQIGPAHGDAPAAVQVCVDRRGVWMNVQEGSCSVHVNGRPVRRLSMLRVGDAIHIDGVQAVLLAGDEVPQRIPEPRNGSGNGSGNGAGGESRMVLRGVGGQYHGRCFELSRTRLVGRLDDCDIRIDAPAFTDRHARLEPHGDTIALRALAPDATSLVNGQPVRDAVLGPGDQVVFDAHHRFVVEAPGRPTARPTEPDEIEVRPMPGPAAVVAGTTRIPWLLLAALLLAAGLGALLLFGAA